jgi:hypothetical protein
VEPCKARLVWTNKNKMRFVSRIRYEKITESKKMAPRHEASTKYPGSTQSEGNEGGRHSP